MTQLTLLSKDGCHLCETMKAVIRQVQRHHPITLAEIDISTRPDFERQFGTEIPVLLCGERVVAQHRISTSQLIAALLEAS